MAIAEARVGTTCKETQVAADDLAAAVKADDPDRIRRAVRAWTELLRATPDEAEETAFADALTPLVAHVHRKVRQAVAEAAEVVPTAAFDALLRVLHTDGDHYVRAAIETTARRRAIRRRARTRAGTEEKVLADLLAEIEKKGKGTRRLAQRAVRRGTENFTLKLHHEVSKIATPLEYSLNRLRSHVAQPTLDRAALARDVAVAWDRYRYLWAILEGAREVTRTVVPRFEELALLPVVEEVRTQLALRLGERGDRLAFEVEVAPSLTLEAHRSGLLQALQNFAQNAVEAYREDAPRLEVRVGARTLRAGSQTEITVVDRGCGMTESKCDSLFVPFGSRKPGGTGVGLLIARSRIEEVHGGTLTFESALGVGTTVKVLLPSRQVGR